MILNSNTYLLIGILCINILIGIIVIIRNYKNSLYKSFFALIFFLSLWILSIVLISNSYYYKTDELLLIVISRLPFLLIAGFIGFFLYFSYLFPLNLRLNNRNKFIILLVTSIVAFLSCTPLVIVGIKFDNLNPVPVYGNLFFIFPVYLITFVTVAFRELIRKFISLTGIYKHQLKYLIVGLFVLILGATTTNLVLPAFFDFKNVFIVGPIFVLFFNICVAYAIVKYRLMNIKLIVTRSLIFILLIGLISTAFVFVSYLTAVRFQQTGINGYIIWVVFSFLIVLGLDPLKNFFARVTDSIFYKEKINYAVALKQLSNLINEELELTSLVQHFRLELKEYLKLQYTDVLIEIDNTDVYLPLEYYYQHPNQRLKKQVPPELKPYYNSSAVKYLLTEPKTIVTDELDRYAYDVNDEKHKRKLQRVVENLTVLKAAVIVPIIRHDKLRAFIVVGQKISGETFSDEDINLFEVLASQFGAALDRSRLYQEVQAFNIKLQSEIDIATKDLQVANEHLKELDQAKSEFMSIASHQLRTPLTGIVGYLSMIQQGDYGKVTPDQMTVVNDVFQASQRLVRLVNTFLNVTRIEAGRFTLTFTNTNLSEVVATQVKELVPTANKKKLELVYDQPVQPIEAMVDDKIRDVFLNLIDNAIKYTQKGKVIVHLEPKNKTKVHFWVEDTGVGIKPHDAKELFQKFVRGSKIAQIQPDGSGLGLYIVRKIVEGHRGEAWAESMGEGKGSKFHVVIPIKQKSAEYKANPEELFDSESKVDHKTAK